MSFHQLVYFTILIKICDSANILAVFPVPSYSHQVTFKPIMQELAKRGHKLTILASNYRLNDIDTNDNITEIDLSSANSELIEIIFKQLETATDIVSQQEIGLTNFHVIFEKHMQIREVQMLIKDRKQHFDIIFVEACMRQALVFSHIFKAPVIQISSYGGTFGMFESIGAATHPILYPSGARQIFKNLTFWKKLSEYYSHYYLMNIYYHSEIINNEGLKKIFGADIPNLSELEKNIVLEFLNIHPVWDNNRPVPPNVVYLGGIYQKPSGALDKEILQYLDKSLNGVIYVSFGTNVHSGILRQQTMKMMVQTFSKLPYNFLMKYDDGTITEEIKNIKTIKWVSQADVLMHPNVKLFITQGGLQSTYESIAAGVPLIGIPMMWDQWLNVDKYLQFDIGLQLEFDSMNENILRNSIETVMTDKRFRRNIIKLRSVMNDLPQTPIETAVWWTEYAIRHAGAKHMRTPAAFMDLKNYYEIELVSYLVLVSVAIILCFGICICFVYKLTESNVKRIEIILISYYILLRNIISYCGIFFIISFEVRCIKICSSFLLFDP